MHTATPPLPARFFGPSVIRAAFVLALFGWGVGFYGPAIFLHEVMLVMVAVVATLALAVFAKSPETQGQQADGDAPGAAPASITSSNAVPLPGAALWRDPRFVTLALGMALGLFAQIGLVAHLFSLLVPALGPQFAGLAMGLATACAIAGRFIATHALPSGAERRLVAAAAYGVQVLGTLVLLAAGEQQIGPMLLGVMLFGSGIGNATSLPPLIAQVEFVKGEVPRVVALIVAMAQATYAFAPAVFGVVLAYSGGTAARVGAASGWFFAGVGLVQCAALLCFLAGRRRT